MPVYFIQAGSAGANPLKIGVASSVRSRLSQLQGSHYEELRLIGTVSLRGMIADDTTALARTREQALEGRLHRMFDAFRVRGEWFYPDPIIAQWVARNASLTEHGVWFCNELLRRFDEDVW